MLAPGGAVTSCGGGDAPVYWIVGCGTELEASACAPGPVALEVTEVGGGSAVCGSAGTAACGATSTVASSSIADGVNAYILRVRSQTPPATDVPYHLDVHPL